MRRHRVALQAHGDALMSTFRQFLTPAILVAAAASLAACANAPYRLPGERAAELPPDRGLVTFEADTVGNKAVRRVQYTDNEQRVDYALFEGGGARAEFVYMETKYFLNVAFDFDFTIRDKVETWNFSKGQPIQWEEATRIYSEFGPAYYRPYRLTAMNRSCFGVSGQWDYESEDPEFRSTRILFGYYCAPPGEALGGDKLLSLVDNIGIKGVTERAPGHAERVTDFYADIEAVQPGGRGRQAIEVAQAAIDGFPFRYARYFFPTDGNDNDFD